MTAWSERVLVAALAWGALSFGAVYPWGYWPLALVNGALGLRLVVATRAWQDPRTRTLGVVLGVIAACIGLQLLALPHSVIDRLSPAIDQFFREYQFGYRPAAVRPLSIAPASTAVALALFVSFALLLLGLVRSFDQSSIESLLNRIMVLGVALALIGVVQKAMLDPAAPPLVYGFWKPAQGGNPFGPFINRNHFAGWMVMALPLVAGYAAALFAHARPRERSRIAWLRWMTTVEASRFVLVSFSALVMAMAIVLTRSRSGVASLAVATFVFGVLAMREVKEGRSRALIAVTAALVLSGAILWGGADATIGRFLTAREHASGRLLAWQDTAHIIADFPVFGTGLGTYGRAMLVYQTAERPHMYVQAHNDYLQIVAEGGLLVAVPAAIAFAIVIAGIRRRLRRRQDESAALWIRVGAVAGLAGIAAQSAVEFSLQMPGNAVLFVALLAIALHRGGRVARPAPRAAQSTQAGLHAHRI